MGEKCRCARLISSKRSLRHVKESLPGGGRKLSTTYDRSSLIERAVITLKRTARKNSSSCFVCRAFLFHVRRRLLSSQPAVGILAAFIVMNRSRASAKYHVRWGIAIAIGAMVDACDFMIENMPQTYRANAPLTKGQPLANCYQAHVEVGTGLVFSLLIITFSFPAIFALEARRTSVSFLWRTTKTLCYGRCRDLSVHNWCPSHGYFISRQNSARHKNPVTGCNDHHKPSNLVLQSPSADDIGGNSS